MGNGGERKESEQDVIDYIRIMSFDRQSSRDLITILKKCGLLVSARDALALTAAMGEQQSGRLASTISATATDPYRQASSQPSHSASNNRFHAAPMYVCMYVCINNSVSLCSSVMVAVFSLSINACMIE